MGVAVRQRLCLTIATPALRIGWQGGVWPRRLGSAVTGARVAHRQQVVAPEHHDFCQVLQELDSAGVFAPSSGVIQFLLHLVRVFLVLSLVMGKQSHLVLAHAPSSGAW